MEEESDNVCSVSEHIFPFENTHTENNYGSSAESGTIMLKEQASLMKKVYFVVLRVNVHSRIRRGLAGYFSLPLIPFSFFITRTKFLLDRHTVSLAKKW